jgi:phosphotransferase system enzyme I (PtsI)
MQLIQGLAISGSVFIGKVRILQPTEFQIAQKTIDSDQISAELQKLNDCIKLFEKDITDRMQHPETSQLNKDILNTHLLILTDIEIYKILENVISKDLMSAPQAVSSAFEQVIRNFEQMDNNYYAQRADDYKDVAHVLIKLLLGYKENEISFKADDIVFMHEITPSQVSSFAQKGLKAYCTIKGSYVSHSSILTRALGLTALVAKEDLISKLSDGEIAILDSEQNCIIINPDTRQISEYKNKKQQLNEKNLFLKSLLKLPAISKNKIRIALKANLEYPSELKNVLENNCEGIGLFRTEFLYLNRQTLPDETEQTRVYSEILSGLHGLPVTFRTFDLGGDKLTNLIPSPKEENPNLGCRGIRFSLRQLPLFKTQIRAILRASVHGKANLMFPMIIGVEDFMQAKDIVIECSNELHKEGIEFDRNIPLGVMIETPSAALGSAHLAKVCDFFSIGTNDLVQYTLAVDRNNDNVASYFIQHHPSVLMLIKQTITSAKQAGIPVSVCGEMASELMYAPLLVGMGIDELSVNPLQALPVKAVIRNCDEQLFKLIDSFDFNTRLASIERLLKETLKPYYTIQS